jgi:hypothetical protein
MNTKSSFVKLLTVNSDGWCEEREMELVTTLTSENPHPENYYG